MTQSLPPRSITIIGGGFAGAVTAIKLLDQRHMPVAITLIESRPWVGRGAAYGTREMAQLVNGPARIFGLHPERPDHLVDWLRDHGEAEGWPLPGNLHDASPPRWLYGTYVESELARAVADARGRSTFRVVHDRAATLWRERGRIAVETANEKQVRGDITILATGVFPPELTAEEATLAAGGHYVLWAWDTAGLDRLTGAKRVLLIGTSLSMVDAIASLETRGYSGEYVAISRRGQVVDARQRGPVEPWRDFLGEDGLPRTALALLRQVKAERRAIAAAGLDWQGLPLSIKPHLKTIWRGASDAERLRFARHLRAFWDVTAHRAAPESYAHVVTARDHGRLTTVTGRVLTMEEDRSGVAVTYRERRTGSVVRETFDAVINCRGHQLHDWTRIDDPFIRNLLADGHVRPHATGFGIDATQAGEVIGRNGSVQRDLLAIGHPLRGVSWESSSIGEQLAQAIALAEHLAAPVLETA